MDGLQFIDRKTTKNTTTKASIHRLACRAGISKETDTSLRIGQFHSKADGLRAYKNLQVRRARKRLLVTEAPILN
jgi:hypothetical protein